MPTNLKQRLGLRVRAIRARRGLTQEQLATRVNRTAETISNIERGRTLPGLATLECLSRQLEIPLRDFFDAEPKTRPVDARRLQIEIKLQDVVRSLSDEGAEIALRQIEALAGLTGRES